MKSTVPCNGSASMLLGSAAGPILACTTRLGASGPVVLPDDAEADYSWTAWHLAKEKLLVAWQTTGSAPTPDTRGRWNGDCPLGS